MSDIRADERPKHMDKLAGDTCTFGWVRMPALVWQIPDAAQQLFSKVPILGFESTIIHYELQALQVTYRSSLTFNRSAASIRYIEACASLGNSQFIGNDWGMDGASSCPLRSC